MKIYSVLDPEFKAYGQVVTGLDDAVAEILTALETTPLPEAVGYVPTDPVLQNLPAAEVIRDHCYGGMPTQLGWCNGHNTMLNALEYHRDSEFNLGTEDFILLLGLQADIKDGILDTDTIKAFRCPKGVLIEVFATSLHYAPCHCDPAKGFRVLVALPWLTNTERPEIEIKNAEDEILTARNKWLLPHPDSNEAKSGVRVGMRGENINIADSI
ncbi:MAG: DUF4867 family protein [Clostridia bacterium]|nr:DUF4867 family protein [Clostridia bacterium]